MRNAMRFIVATFTMLGVIFGLSNTASAEVIPPRPPAIGEAVQEAFDRPFAEAAGLILGIEDRTMPPQEQFDAAAPLDQQLRDASTLFLPQVITPDHAACDIENKSFEQDVACSTAVIADNNDTGNIGQVVVTGRYTPGLVYPNGCLVRLYDTNYCGDGSITISKPVWSDSPSGTVMGLLAHENGHEQDDQSMAEQGASYTAHVGEDVQQYFEMEQSADYQSGVTMGNAIANSQLSWEDTESFVTTLRMHSYDWDATHGGPDVREAKIRQGLADSAIGRSHQ